MLLTSSCRLCHGRPPLACSSQHKSVPAVTKTTRVDPTSCTCSGRKLGPAPLLLPVWLSLVLVLLGGSCRGSDSKMLCDADEKPLLLSPLIAAGQTHLAQEKSRVRCLSGSDVDSYAGFISVDKPVCDSHLFFWFFPAQENTEKAPVLLWLNGGPDRSSLYGAMFEHGPLQLTEPLSDTVRRRNVTWVKYFSMLYVDNPLGAGFSYTNNNCYSSTLNETSANLYSFLQQFFLLFSQFSANDFYIGGQSYAGKYVPALGYYIHHQMDSSDKPRMRLKGFYIGSGFCDPETMFPEYPEMLYNVGIYTDYTRRQHKQIIMEGWSKPHHNPFHPEERDFWRIMTYYFKEDPAHKVVFVSSVYDQRRDFTEDGHLDKKLYHFLSIPSVKSALHTGGLLAREIPHISRFHHLEAVRGVRQEMAFLMDRYKVLHYTGNMDIIINVRMTEAFLMATPWRGQAAYNKSQRHPWMYNARLAGYVTQLYNFTRVVIRNAGHDAPADQPDWTLAMMQRFIHDQPFESSARAGL
ncbi:probable serine carboxypeptidase CPVL isoform X2 [Pomacea canaliculata]|uniref:probable serine carboxypeptidase CPVL isoform X2 n=1 Tax=Pomacea canaliculata TaxID=400727 RepID=UPI000D73853C|nr:probable serine carboxypeptidase CPVL isoform X2 [Pomacea canaliculata]